MPILEAVYEVDIGHGRTPSDDLDSVELCLDPLKVAIAVLSDGDIGRMRPHEVADVIKLSGVFSSRGWNRQLQFMESENLNRLAFLARRSCRHDVNALYEQRGRRGPFLSDL